MKSDEVCHIWQQFKWSQHECGQLMYEPKTAWKWWLWKMHQTFLCWRHPIMECLNNKVKNMATNALVPCFTRTSTAMVLNMLDNMPLPSMRIWATDDTSNLRKYWKYKYIFMFCIENSATLRGRIALTFAWFSPSWYRWFSRSESEGILMSQITSMA